MSLEKASLEDIAGYLGVGALALLGVFFIVDGLTGFFDLVEWYAKTSSFAILFTIPGVVVAYVVGVIASLLGDLFPRRTVVLTPRHFAKATTSRNDALVRRYLDVERVSRLLNGCTLAFFLVGLGLLSEVQILGRFKLIGYLGFAAGLGLAILCPFVARAQQRRLLPYIEAVELAAKDKDA